MAILRSILVYCMHGLGAVKPGRVVNYYTIQYGEQSYNVVLEQIILMFFAWTLLS